MHRAYDLIDTPYLGYMDEREYVIMIDSFLLDLDEGVAVLLATLLYCLLIVLYETFPFMFWSKAWPEVIQYGLSYRVAGIDGECYFVGWYNHELFIEQPKERAKLHMQVPGW